jgi:N-acetylneuraminic acid mutarotase
MADGRFQHTATLLPSGSVLVTGGGNGAPGITAEIYDPVAGTWQTANSMGGLPRIAHQAVLVDPDTVLVAGGTYLPDGTTQYQVQNTAMLFDVSDGTWSATEEPMAFPRAYFTATLLGDGTVLVAGGMTNGAGTCTNTAELYDPVTGEWTATSETMSAARCGHRATLLASGDVLVTGGAPTWDAAGKVSSAEIYDLETGTWSDATAMPFATMTHTATLLADGNVLVAGGFLVRRAAIYDAVGGTWTEVDAPLASHDMGAAALLPSGKVLVASGRLGATFEDSELFDPVTGTWMLTGRQRYYHAEQPQLTILQDGRALLTGGNPSGSTPPIREAEIFTEADVEG